MTSFDPPPSSGARLIAGPAVRRSAPMVVALAALVLLLAPAGPVLAQDPFDCADPVVDTSGAVDVATVDAAWAGIDRSRIGPDATVLVRVWDAVPGADLAAAVDEVVAVCAGDPALGIAADAVMLGLSVGDGRSDVLIGGAWSTAVTDVDQLRTEVMGPPLAAGDVTGGLVAALEALAAGVDALPPAAVLIPSDDADPEPDYAAVDDSSAESDGEATIASEPVPEPEPSSSGDGSPVAIVLGVLGLGACGGAAVLVNRRRTLGQERDRLRRKVEPALGRLRVLRERHQRLLDQAEVWNQTSAGRTRTEVTTGRRSVESAGNDTDRAAGLLHRSIPDGIDEASKAQAVDGQERVAELLRVLEAHAGELDELAALGAHLDHLEITMPVKAEMLAHELPEVRQMANTRVDEGWKVDSAREQLTAIQTTIGEVEEVDAQLEVDLLDLSDRLEDAEAALFSVDHELQTLPDRPGSLERWSERLDEAADEELARADAMRRQIALVSLTHAAESWRWAVDRPEGAIEALERADGHQEAAMEELVPAQRFDEAGAALDAAGLELMVADDLLDQVDDLLVDLESARADAPAIVEQLGRSLESLDAIVGRHHQDLSPEVLDRRLELHRVSDGLRAELGRPKPNFIRVVESAEDTERTVDELLVTIDEQHQAAEAMRRELGRQQDRARRALARARQAIRWLPLPNAEDAALDRLEAELLATPEDLAAAIEHTEDIADGALAVQEQVIARRRRRAAAVSIGTSPSWGVGGSGSRSRPGRSRRSRSRSGRSSSHRRSSGGRSFGGRRRSSGGRRTGSRRSTGRF